MERFISLLRGINVGGQKKIPMEALRTVYERLGLTHVRTYLQSGNIIFDCPPQDRSALAGRLESAIQGAYGFNVSVFIRQAEDLHKILSSNPFLNQRKENPSTLHVIFLYHNPPDTTWRTLPPPAGIADEFAPGESVIYLFCPQGYGRTRLSNSFFERKLGMPVTTRNWNTVSALYQLASE